MVKAEKGSAKDVANRSKSKGLQKLRFYCQMCEKQCRDENGFKCHQMSESHLRQMRIFADNSGTIMDDYSEEFEHNFVEVLHRRHGIKRMRANLVYQEVIADKTHIHMNSTKWVTLSVFCQYLGKKGTCIVEEDEKGWYVQYIERDTNLLSKQEAASKRAASERADEVRSEKRLEYQRREAALALDKAGLGDSLKSVPTAMNKNAGPMKGMSLAGSSSSASGSNAFGGGMKKRGGVTLGGWGGGDDDDDEKGAKKVKLSLSAVVSSAASIGSSSGSSSALESIMKEQQVRKEKEAAFIVAKEVQLKNAQDAAAAAAAAKMSTDITKKSSSSKSTKKKYWLHTGIIVKVINKKLANGAYYKTKCLVKQVIDKYTGEVQVLDDSGDILRIDQDELETVIPKVIGEAVMIVNGEGRGKEGVLVSLNSEKYYGSIKVGGEVIERVDFEFFSKLG
jgi:DNA/RNA-binding protein KIN17